MQRFGPNVRRISKRSARRRSLLPEPSAALFDPSANVRAAAESALEKIDSQLYWPVRALASRPDESTHARAIAALRKMKDHARAAVPILLYHLSSTVLESRLSSAEVLQTEIAAAVRHERAKIQDSDPIETILEKILAQALNEMHADVDAEELTHLKERQAQLPRLIHLDMQALADIGGDEKIVLKTLTDVSRNREVAFRLDALGVLQELGASHPKLRLQIVLAILPRARDVSPEIRLFAVRSLGTYGKDAARAIPTLRRLKVKDGSEEVRATAAQSLEKIEGKQSSSPPPEERERH